MIPLRRWYFNATLSKIAVSPTFAIVDSSAILGTSALSLAFFSCYFAGTAKPLTFVIIPYVACFNPIRITSICVAVLLFRSRTTCNSRPSLLCCDNSGSRLRSCSASLGARCPRSPCTHDTVGRARNPRFTSLLLGSSTTCSSIAGLLSCDASGSCLGP